MKKLNVVFCGTPDFSVPTLDLLFHHPLINLIGVITMPDRPVGRGLELKPPPVATFAKENNIKLFQTEKIGGLQSVKSLKSPAEKISQNKGKFSVGR